MAKIEIVTYQATNPDQRGPKALAKVFLITDGAKGPQGVWLPILFAAETPAEAEILADGWWSAERKKAADLQAAHEARAAGRRRALDTKAGGAPQAALGPPLADDEEFEEEAV